MRCSKCGSENLSGKRFCGECGFALEVRVRCPKCSSDNPHSSKFCGDCGSALTPEALKEAVNKPAGERRHLTVLFSDLIDSTLISHSLDPEEWQEMVTEYQRV